MEYRNQLTTKLEQLNRPINAWKKTPLWERG